MLKYSHLIDIENLCFKDLEILRNRCTKEPLQ